MAKSFAFGVSNGVAKSVELSSLIEAVKKIGFRYLIPVHTCKKQPKSASAC